MTLDRISRRTLLAGITGGSAASLGGLALMTEGSRAYTDTMQLQTEAIEDCVIDWRETYNGATLTDTTAGTVSTEPSGPAISLGNVLPGDSGSLSVRLRIVTDGSGGGDGPAVEPKLTVSLRDGGEPTSIQEYIDIAVWYDTGLFDVGALGSDNAEHDPGERLVDSGASGTLGDVAAALEDGVALDASPLTPGASCLGAEDAVTVTFGWSFPPDQADINAAQGDTVEFDIQFDVTQC